MPQATSSVIYFPKRSKPARPQCTVYQMYYRAANGEWKPVRGLIFALRSSAEKLLQRSPEPLEIRVVQR